MNLVLDSFAWMEFFKGTTRGRKVLELLGCADNRFYTTTGNYYEIYYRLTQECGKIKMEEALAYIRHNTTLLDITEELARMAGEIRLKEGLSAIDAFTLAAARANNAKVVTGDRDFSRFKEEIIPV